MGTERKREETLCRSIIPQRQIPNAFADLLANLHLELEEEGIMLLQSVIYTIYPLPTALPWAMEFVSLSLAWIIHET